MALAFALPAFEAHACQDADAGDVAAASATSGDDGCPDCGTACANGCCHAPHPAIAPEPAQIAPALETHDRVARPEKGAPPDLRPSGPERPPRP